MKKKMLTRLDRAEKARKKREAQIEYSRMKTPGYDKVCQSIRKYLAAGAQTFIPESCLALRQDLVPKMSYDALKSDENKGIRDYIKDRILDDWDKEKNIDGLWSGPYILQCVPEWLKSKVFQDAEGRRPEGWQKLSKNRLLSDDQKRDLKRYTARVSDSVVMPRQKEPWETGPAPGEIMDRQPLFRGLGEHPKKSIMTILGEINRSAMDLYRATTQEKDIPRMHDDLLVDHIRPARERMRSFALELKNADPGPMFNGLLANLRYAVTAANEMISIMSEVGSSD